MTPRQHPLAAYALLFAICAAGCGQDPNPNARQIPAPTEAAAPPAARNVPIDPALADAARTQLAKSLRSPSATPRVHALEAVASVDSPQFHPGVIAALSADEPITRFAAAMTAGTLSLPEARPRLLQLADDPDFNVRVAVRYALHRLGDFRYSHDLERLSRDPRKDVRANTAMVLGMLDEPSALKLLIPMTHDPEPLVRDQVVEAMWRLHDETALQTLVAMTVSRYPDEEMVALIALAEPRDQRVRQHVRTALTADYIEVKLVAARAMGMLGSDDGYSIALDGATSKDARQRFMAAIALGAIGRPDAQPALKKLLADEYESVRVAAAQAILQLK